MHSQFDLPLPLGRLHPDIKRNSGSVGNLYNCDTYWYFMLRCLCTQLILLLGTHAFYLQLRCNSSCSCQQAPREFPSLHKKLRSQWWKGLNGERLRKRGHLRIRKARLVSEGGRNIQINFLSDLGLDGSHHWEVQPSNFETWDDQGS